MLESLSTLSALTRDLFLMLLDVSCPIPTGIPNGFITFAVMRQHGYKDRVRYGCNDHYVLDGEAEIQCRNTGNWSSKPVCRGESWEHQNTCGFVFVYPSRNLNNQDNFIPMCIMKLTHERNWVSLAQLLALSASREAASSTTPGSCGSQIWNPTEFSMENMSRSIAWTKPTGVATLWPVPVTMESSPSRSALRVRACSFRSSCVGELTRHLDDRQKLLHARY